MVEAPAGRAPASFEKRVARVADVARAWRNEDTVHPPLMALISSMATLLPEAREYWAMEASWGRDVGTSCATALPLLEDFEREMGAEGGRTMFGAVEMLVGQGRVVEEGLMVRAREVRRGVAEALSLPRVRWAWRRASIVLWAWDLGKERKDGKESEERTRRGEVDALCSGRCPCDHERSDRGKSRQGEGSGARGKER